MDAHFRSTQAIEACPDVELFRQPGTVFDRHGSVWQRPSLGEDAGRVWAYGQAEAICEAVGRPNMQFVAMKSVEQ